MILEFGGHGEETILEFPKARKVKMYMVPWMGIFWNHSIEFNNV